MNTHMVDIYLSKKDMRDTKCFLIQFYFCERFLWFWCVSSFALSLSLIGTFLRAYTLVLRGKWVHFLKRVFLTTLHKQHTNKSQTSKY